LTPAAPSPNVLAVPSRQSITLKGMRFHTLVGVLPHEEQLPQPLEIDVTVWLGADRTMLDYRALYDAVAGVVKASPVRYLEDLVGRAAAAALDVGDVARVRVAARKPHVALPGPLAYAEVAIERERHG
jgi:FolB domain-containing protein